MAPEIWARLAVDYHFEKTRLTPGLAVGVHRPAHRQATVAGAAGSDSVQTILILPKLEQSRQVLAADAKVSLSYALKATCRWDMSESISALAELNYTYDPNQGRLMQGPDGVAVRSSETVHLIGLNMLIQARF
jgi:hypothetical protein